MPNSLNKSLDYYRGRISPYIEPFGRYWQDLPAKLRQVLVKRLVKKIYLLNYLSDKNFVFLISLARKIDKAGRYSGCLDVIEKSLKEKHPAVSVGRNVFQKSKKCKEKLIMNFFYNAVLAGQDERLKFKEQYQLPAPFFFVVSPLMRCNLHCLGCYAGQYQKETDLEYDVLDRIFDEAKTMGIYFITVSGGEPFLRKDLLELFAKHNDMYFQVFTNGTLINRELAQRLANLGNVAPVISIEGFEKETDGRRGQGTFNNVVGAMANLKEAGVIFGFSTMPSCLNWKTVASDEFYKFLVDQGCFFGWMFQYIPIGRQPDVKLMLSPSQRLAVRDKVREARNKYPIFVADFWNDGKYVEGCLAGGKDMHGYFHINTNGDVEPCVFAHFAQDNIKKIYEKGGHLRDVLRSELFCRIRAGQPWNRDHRMPCMIIDNPHCLRNMVGCNAKVYSTETGAESLVKNPQITRHLDNYSSELRKLLAKEDKA